MSTLIGYLIVDRIEDLGIFKGWAWAEDFRPDGTIVTVEGHPSEKLSPSSRKQFTEGAMAIYTRLREKGFKEIMMAMVMYSDAFDDYELKYLDRKADPSSHDDWLALREVFEENFRRENEFYERYRTPKARMAKVFKSKKKRVEMKTKGVLAVARIRGGLEDVSGG